MNTKTKIPKAEDVDITPKILHFHKAGSPTAVCGAPKPPRSTIMPSREVPKEWRCPKCSAWLSSRN